MRKLLLVVVPFLIAGCGDLFSVEAHAKEVCVRQTGQTLQGTGAMASAPLEGSLAPAGSLPPATISGSISDRFPLELGDVTDFTKSDIDARLDLRSFQLTADPGTFAGLERLSVHLDPPAGSALPPLTLVDFSAAAAAAGTETPISIVGDTVTVNLAALKADLLAYATAGTLTVQVDAEGTLPVAEWHADVQVCAAADATYDYGSKLGL